MSCDIYELAFNCLRDTKRTEAFQRAIQSTVRSGDTVLEVGAGTGILSLFAAACKAQKVYAIESCEHLCDVMRQVVRRNHYREVIEIICENGALLMDFDPVDVLIMELMSTALINEKQVPIFNALVQRGIITETTRMVPLRYTTYGQLGASSYKLFGFDMKIPQHEQPWFPPITKRLTEPEVVADVFFVPPLPVLGIVDRTVEFTILENEVVNSFIFSGVAELSPGIRIKQTLYFNNPIIIPLPELRVERGQMLKVRILYEMGGGLENVYISI